MAPRTKKKEYRTSVILSEDQHAAIKAQAEQQDASVAWVIRKAVEHYLSTQSESSFKGSKDARNN